MKRSSLLLGVALSLVSMGALAAPPKATADKATTTKKAPKKAGKKATKPANN